MHECLLHDVRCAAAFFAYIPRLARIAVRTAIRVAIRALGNKGRGKDRGNKVSMLHHPNVSAASVVELSCERNSISKP